MSKYYVQFDDVHFEHPTDEERTLCGNMLEAGHDWPAARSVKPQPITCRMCREILLASRLVPYEYIHEVEKFTGRRQTGAVGAEIPNRYKI